MPESTTQEPSLAHLPQALAVRLLELRQDPLFLQILQAYQLTPLPTYRRQRAGTDETQEKNWIWASGKLEGEQCLLKFLLGTE